MSLIYEALRKSEAERQRGETPHLTSESLWIQHGDMSQKRRATQIRRLILLSLLLMLAGIWWWMRLPTSNTITNINTTQQLNIDTTPISPKLGESVSSDTTPHAINTIKNQPELVTQVTAPPLLRNTQPPSLDTAPHSALAGVKNITSQPPESFTKNPLEDPLEKQGEAIANETVKTVSIPSRPKTVPTAPPTKPNNTQSNTDKNTIPTILRRWELPLITRQALPEVQITMRVYAEVPEQRFIIINDERFNEGDTLEEQLTIKEIRTDGVIFEFNGQTFLETP